MLTVSAVLLSQMQAQDDHPLEDANLQTNHDGSLTERCWGTKGLYIASNVSGFWEAHGPFGDGE